MFSSWEIREDLINKSTPRPQISRTDGNHRLFFGEGDSKNPLQFPPLTVSTPFAMTINVVPESRRTCSWTSMTIRRR